MISVQFDVTKLDKERFYKGAKGTYCKLILIETPGGQYGDYMVKQEVTKEERESGVQLPILGNGKNIGSTTRNRPAAPQSRASEPDDDEIPF